MKCQTTHTRPRKVNPMKRYALPLALVVFTAANCVSSKVRFGQRLFAGCVEKVNDQQTINTGQFVCDGPREPEPFGGNGRACGSCHMPGDNFGMSLATIAVLPADHPFFFPGLDEDQDLLREFGLVHVIAPGGIDEFRRTGKLNHLQKLCKSSGKCDALGLLSDRTQDLGTFSAQAVDNHLAKTEARIPGDDFRVPTRKELEALVAYMLSDLVADSDKR